MSLSSATTNPVTFPAPVLPKTWKMDDLQAHLGGIPLSRIRMFPPPGMATEEDAFAIHRQEGVLCELVDGVLVEKPMGWIKSSIAAYLAYCLHKYLAEHPEVTGEVLGADGPVRVPDQMRLPDVSFVRQERLTEAAYAQKVLPVTPDLVVEVLSEGNTTAEIDRKLDEYFTGGTQLAWIIDPETRTASLYGSRSNPVVIDEGGVLSGGKVLPGFAVTLAEVLRGRRP